MPWHALLCCGAADYIPVLLDDRRFMIFSAVKNYREAYTACDSNSATLATLKSQEETNKLLAKVPSTYALWMGLTNTLPPQLLSGYGPPTTDKAQWMWLSTRQPPEWDHWANLPIPADAEPNNWANGEGRCAAVYGTQVDDRPDGFWNDL